MPSHSRRAVYPQVASRLLTHLRTRADGAALPSGRALAAEFALPVATVSKAILSLIGQGMLRREGSRLRLAEAAVRPEAPPIHVVSFLHEDLDGARSVAAVHGSQVVAHHATSAQLERHHLTRLLAATPCHGLLIRARELSALGPLLERFERHGTAVVTCGEDCGPHSFARPDYEEGVRRLVAHLAALGHRRLALVVEDDFVGISQRRIGAFTEACRVWGLAEAENVVFRVPTSGAEADHAAAVRDFYLRQPALTAIICSHEATALALLGTLRALGVSVPGELSVVVCRDTADCRHASPPLTALDGTDPFHDAQLAAGILFHHLRELGRTGRLPTRQRVRIEPHLAVRESCGPAPRGRRAVRAGPSPPAPDAVPDVDVTHRRNQWQRRRREFAQTWEHAYRPPPGPGERWEPLPLEAQANRSRTRRNCWLGGMPLLHLDPGERAIHGVPFRIINERANGGRGALVLRSLRARRAGGDWLPSEVELPLGRRRLREIYFLHGCGYAHQRRAFAEYQMVYADGTIAAVPLVAQGNGPLDGPGETPHANVQDWWPLYEQFNSPEARHLAVTGGGDWLEYLRFLYTLRWVNPRPDRPIQKLRLLSDPLAAMTIGVLAITLLTAERGA